MRVDMKEVLALLDTVKDGAAFADRLKELDAKEKAVQAKLRIADSVDKVIELERKLEARAAELEARAFALEEATKKQDQLYKAAFNKRMTELEERSAIERARYNEGRTSMEEARKLSDSVQKVAKAVSAKEKEIEEREVVLKESAAKVIAKIMRIYQIMGEE